jgi:hypothetical protein
MPNRIGKVSNDVKTKTKIKNPQKLYQKSPEKIEKISFIMVATNSNHKYK